MKELLALAILLSLSTTTIVLAARKNIGTGLATLFLAFALVSAWLISHHDRPREGVFELLPPQRSDDSTSQPHASSPPIDQRQPESQATEPIAPPRTTNELHAVDISKNSAIEELHERLKRAEEGLKTGTQSLQETGEKLEEVKIELETLRRETSEMTLLITRIIWLQLETKGDAGSERAEAATQQILNQLDDLVNLAISDPDARSRFVDDVKGALPPKRRQ